MYVKDVHNVFGKYEVLFIDLQKLTEATICFCLCLTRDHQRCYMCDMRTKWLHHLVDNSGISYKFSFANFANKCFGKRLNIVSFTDKSLIGNWLRLQTHLIWRYMSRCWCVQKWNWLNSSSSSWLALCFEENFNDSLSS